MELAIPPLGLVVLLAVDASAAKPNVLWITTEDWSPDLSCYGTNSIHSPKVNQRAAAGIRYEAAFTTSTSRSAMMTEFHQNYVGAHRHREPNDSLARPASSFTKKPKRS